MSVAESIKRAREGGIPDKEILKEVKRQNPHRESFFREKEVSGLTDSQILKEVVNSENKKGDKFNLRKFYFLLFSVISFLTLIFVIFYFDVLDIVGIVDIDRADNNMEDADRIFAGSEHGKSDSAIETSREEGEKHFFDSNIVSEDIDEEIGAEETDKEEDSSREEKENVKKEGEVAKEEDILNENWEGEFLLPILMYHHIEDLPSNVSNEWRELTVSPAIFKEQMNYLSENNYNPITFKDLQSFIENNEPLPEKSLIITFDDGWLNQYENAFPILREYDFTATFFVVGRYVGGSSFMNKIQIKEMIEEEMEIGSHSMTHANLVTVSEKDLRQEVAGSKVLLENVFDVDVISFAYPYGAIDRNVVSAVESAGYHFARTTSGGIDQSNNNLYNLKTVHITNNLSDFKKIFSL